MNSGWTFQFQTGPQVLLNQDISMESNPTFQSITVTNFSGASISVASGSFSSLIIQNAIHMQSGALMDSVDSNADTLYIDGHLNVSNLFTLDAISGLTSFATFTGGQIQPVFVS